jgi:hypothetical protein
MPEEDDMARLVRKLVVEHAETRWLALRVDADIQEIRAELRSVRDVQGGQSAKLDEHSATLQEHTARFDSVDSQLRSLTQMVGQVLERLDDH